jgi:hypothetical protein
MALFRTLASRECLRISETGLSSKFPACGIRAAEVGQQTASGISPIGVEATPPWPVDNFTPVKKIPITKSSTCTFPSGIGNFSVMILIVSATTEVIMIPQVSLFLKNGVSLPFRADAIDSVE